MKRLFAWLLAGVAGVSFAGCSRVQTKIVEKPRVDQEIQGNKGYLKGSGPAGGPRRTTREMVETNVELPTWAEMNPWRKGKPEAAPGTAAPAYEPSYEQPSSSGWQQQEEYNIPPVAETPSSVSAPVGGGTEYTVQKGDTLQKISQKFYGTTKNWYKIYKANKEALKSPDKIRPGQTITIPGAERGGNEYK